MMTVDKDYRTALRSLDRLSAASREQAKSPDEEERLGALVGGDYRLGALRAAGHDAAADLLSKLPAQTAQKPTEAPGSVPLDAASRAERAEGEVMLAAMRRALPERFPGGEAA